MDYQNTIPSEVYTKMKVQMIPMTHLTMWHACSSVILSKPMCLKKFLALCILLFLYLCSPFSPLSPLSPLTPRSPLSGSSWLFSNGISSGGSDASSIPGANSSSTGGGVIFSSSSLNGAGRVMLNFYGIYLAMDFNERFFGTSIPKFSFSKSKSSGRYLSIQVSS